MLSWVEHEKTLYNLEAGFRKNVGKSNFSEQFRKLHVINVIKQIGYSLDVMRQTAF